uniref:Uncharacterized protein n=1 Tax=Romanomermis culicivorax TaxID=13658 RepID=A0A915HJZ8_ROMCU
MTQVTLRKNVIGMSGFMKDNSGGTMPNSTQKSLKCGPSPRKKCNQKKFFPTCKKREKPRRTDNGAIAKEKPDSNY